MQPPTVEGTETIYGVSYLSSTGRWRTRRYYRQKTSAIQKARRLEESGKVVSVTATTGTRTVIAHDPLHSIEEARVEERRKEAGKPRGLLVAALRDRGLLTVQTAAAAMGTSEKTARLHLKALIDAGAVVKTVDGGGRGNAAVYRWLNGDDNAPNDKAPTPEKKG